jgi:glycine hydroxymethyltransferase
MGTPAVTTRGLREPQMKTIAGLIAEVLDAKGSPEVVQSVRERVLGLCREFPIY